MTRRPRNTPDRGRQNRPSSPARPRPDEAAARHRPAGRQRGAAPAPGRLWLYGQHAVVAALRNPDRTCHRLLATEAALPLVEEAARARGLAVETVSPERLAQILPPDTPHQGLALGVEPLPECSPDELGRDPAAPSLVLALDQVNDPRNLGAILRTAAALGVEGVILPQRRSAELGGACAKAASGALDLLPIVEVVNLARTLGELKERGYWLVGLDAAGPQRLEELDLPSRVVLVLGSEGEGLRRLVADACDFLARLEIDPRMESLNVSVAAGIALYVLARRRAAS
ncbi:23S rRNA (guanosine(2251)-2'-O)-methyltransferase RlmB [Benzoatithermus flavus]|uniref:23S rRNA (Guanosine(2251)-2'-O)-methyltransferase RlmB n=1 Tax=Benzoatithermus flavus TaxID=3108223 RepID=A0ABU8XX57_9PROT